MNMKILVLVLLGILVIMSFVQGMQISALENSFEKSLGIAPANANVPAYGSPSASAPSMVGGC